MRDITVDLYIGRRPRDLWGLIPGGSWVHQGFMYSKKRSPGFDPLVLYPESVNLFISQIQSPKTESPNMCSSKTEHVKTCFEVVKRTLI